MSADDDVLYQPGEIITRLVAVMHDLGYVPKEGTGDGIRYKFQAIADILAKAQPILAKHGVIAVPHRIVSHATTDRETAKGNLQVQADLVIRWRFYAVDGSFVSAEAFGHAFDTSDKAYQKATTSSQKYVFKGTFSIPEAGDDQDAERPDVGTVVIRHSPAGLSTGEAKRLLVAMLADRGVTDPKGEAADLWQAQALGRAAGLDEAALVAAVDAWFTSSEPFDAPPPGVDADGVVTAAVP